MLVVHSESGPRSSLSPEPAKRAVLSPSRSNLLNAIRWMSAVLVLISHTRSQRTAYLVYARGQEGRVYHYLSAHGHIAVMFFFVLSGYLIAYALQKSTERNYGFRDYALDRFSRIYSVLPSALALTAILDFIGRAHSAFYSNPELYPTSGYWFRLAANLCAMQGTFGHRIQFGTDAALWSIGYEVWFYVAAGLIYYRRSLFKRSPQLKLAGILGVMAVIAGLEMVAYFLLWGIGYFVYVLYHVKRVRLSRFLFVPSLLLVAIANHWLGYKNPWGVPPYPSDLIIACCFALLLLCDTERLPNLFSGLNRYIADFSYSIYCYHMPILIFWYAVLPAHFLRTLTPALCALLSATVALIISRLMYSLFESRRMALRGTAETVLRRLKLAPAS